MKLNIFGQIIRVLKRRDMIASSGCRGMYRPDEKLIEIDESQVGYEYWHTLVHEIVHSVIYRTGIDQARLDPGVEEILCENVSTAINENFKLTKK